MRIELSEIYRYISFIYRCDRCGQFYPVWLVPDTEWRRGVRNMFCGFGPTKHVCKQCFEEFNPSPNYLTLDEYIELQERMLAATNEAPPQLDYERSPEEMARYRETVTALWDLPPQYTDEEHDAVIEETGWRRGPYRKGVA